MGMRQIYNDGPANYEISRKRTPAAALSSYSTTRISPKARPLYIVDFVPGHTDTHWGLFLGDDDFGTETFGTFWDLVVDTQSRKGEIIFCCCFMFTGSREKRKCYHRSKEHYDTARAVREGKKLLDISGTPGSPPTSTPDRINAACKEVEKTFQYSFAIENCETFVIEILKVLNKWNPNMVPLSTIEHVNRQAACNKKLHRSAL